MLALLFFLLLRDEMTLERWNEFVNTHPDMPSLGMLYAPWCHACQALHPKFEVVQSLYEFEPKVMIYGVDCVDNAELCKLIGTNGFPTFVRRFGNETLKGHSSNRLSMLLEFVEPLLEFSYGEPRYTNYTGEVKSFPAFVFTIEASDRESIHIFKNATLRTSVPKEQVFLELVNKSDVGVSESFQPYGILHFDENRTTPFSANFSATEIQRFIDILAPRSTKTWTSGKLEQRGGIFCIYKRQMEQNSDTERILSIKYADMCDWLSASDGDVSYFLSHLNITNEPDSYLIYFSPRDHLISFLSDITGEDKILDFLKNQRISKVNSNETHHDQISSKASVLAISIGAVFVLIASIFLVRYWKRTRKMD